MGFDKDAELDPRLSKLGAAALLELYERQFQGFKLCKRMKAHSQDEDAKKLVPRIDKAIKAALVDVRTLVKAVAPEAEIASDDADAEVDADAETDDAVEESDDAAESSDEEAPEPEPDVDAPGEAILRELYWRLHDGWSAASGERRGEAATDLKMLVVAGGTPSWIDLASLFGELSNVDRDTSEADEFPSEWYDDLVERFENKLGKKKPKKKTSTKAAPVIRTPPPGANIIEYSPKATFREGEWVEHPKFGVGIVIEAGANVLVEFGPEQKRLAHVPPVAAPSAGPKLKTKTPTDTLELAKAAGIEIKKIPARVDEDK